jgi:hypothetical protein
VSRSSASPLRGVQPRRHLLRHGAVQRPGNRLLWATFSRHTSFDEAQFSGQRISFDGAQFSGKWTSFEGATFSGEATSFEGARFDGEATSFDSPHVWTNVSFDWDRPLRATNGEASPVAVMPEYIHPREWPPKVGRAKPGAGHRATCMNNGWQIFEMLACAVGAESLRVASVRHREVIDSELRPPAAVRHTVRDEGRPMPTTAPMDALLDERLAHRGRAGEDAAVGHVARARQCHIRFT